MSAPKTETYRDSVEYCPKCGANLQGGPIPEKSQHLFGATHFSRMIGHYSMEQDRTIEWSCPDCQHKWGCNETSD